MDFTDQTVIKMLCSNKIRRPITFVFYVFKDEERIYLSLSN